MASSKISAHKQSFGGLIVKNIDEINRKYRCEYCKLLLLDPYQLFCCGVLLCRWCFLNGLSNHEPFVCPICHQKQTKKEGLTDRGAGRELKTIIVVCYACDWKGSYDVYLEHLQKDHSDLECSDCQQRFFVTNLFEEHRQELCNERSIPCGLPDCAESVKCYDMKSHYHTNHHQQKLIKIIHEHAQSRHRPKQNENHLQEYRDIQESIDMTFSTQEILLNDIRRLVSELNQLRIHVESPSSQMEELRRQLIENDNKLKEIIEKQNTTETEVNHIKKLQEEGGIQILDGNSTTILRLNLPTTMPFSINSPKNRTSQYGYTFRFRFSSTTMDGDFSLFLSLCNGEYDNLIPFPFSYDIHVILWDQSQRQDHRFIVLKPDTTSPAFRRPITETNEEYGPIPVCSFRDLIESEKGYLKDGVFFIRLFVDFLNTGRNPFQLKDNNQDTGMLTD